MGRKWVSSTTIHCCSVSTRTLQRHVNEATHQTSLLTLQTTTVSPAELAVQQQSRIDTNRTAHTSTCQGSNLQAPSLTHALPLTSISTQQHQQSTPRRHSSITRSVLGVRLGLPGRKEAVPASLLLPVVALLSSVPLPPSAWPAAPTGQLSRNPQCPCLQAITAAHPGFM